MDDADKCEPCLSNQSLEHVELCMHRCQRAIDDMTSQLDAHINHTGPIDPHRIAEFTSALESSEAALLVALGDHNAEANHDYVGSSSCSIACTLAAGYVMAARVQLAKRQLIHTGNTSMLTKSRDTEDRFICRATELQREALCAAQGEDDVALETSQALPQENVQDAQCMSLSLSRGFSSSSTEALLCYAANAFTLVLKLFAAKCHVVEELICTAVSLPSGVPVGMSDVHHDQERGQERQINATDEKNDAKLCKHCLEAVTRLTGILSKVQPDILSAQAIESRILYHCAHTDDHHEDGNDECPKATERDVAEVDVVPPVSIAVVFASLLWNTALCFWKAGDVVAAHQWLCACDVSQLLRAAKESEMGREAEVKTAKEGPEGPRKMSNDQTVLNEEGENVAFGNLEKPINSYNEQDEVDTFSLSNWKRLLVGTEDYYITEEMSSQHRLRRLARYIMSLRDVCAIVRNCITPRDLLYVINEVHHALELQQQHVPSADIRGEILTVVMRIVELYLSRRAVRHMREEALMSSDDTSSTSADEVHNAVRSVCDELVRYLTSGRYWGVDEIERDGLSLLWETCHSENSAGPDAASRWLRVQVVGMTIAFAAGYSNNSAFSIAVRGREENTTSLLSRGDAKADEHEWIFWSTAVVSKMRHFVFGSGAPAVDLSPAALPGLRLALLPLRDGAPSPRGPTAPRREGRRGHSMEGSAGDGPGGPVLRLPSMAGGGLPLLAEESLHCPTPIHSSDSGSGSGSGSGSAGGWLSLALLLAAYHSARAASTPAPLPAALLLRTSEGLHCAAVRIAAALCSGGDSLWRERRQHTRAQSAARATTAALFATPWRPVNNSMCPRKPTATADIIAPRDSLSLVPPPYDPPIVFDFSAFTSRTAKALCAVRQLVQSLETADAALDANARGACLLSRAARRLLHSELPVLWQFMPWRVVYSTQLHGVSYASLLACSARAIGPRGGPMILAIAPRGNSRLVIGAVLSHAPVLGSQRFYGGSETCLFQMMMPQSPESPEEVPQLRIFRSTGANAQYINCRLHSLAIGGGGAGCGLFLDDALLHASSAACATFDSPPLTRWDSGQREAESQTATESFEIAALELLAVGEAVE